ncbi:recombinase family protein [Microbacterium sp.]|uniref:recombinase family protein n=1 Tax=Microbacterium sp. TaxID=51671 RepID=UPI003A83BA85
MEEFVDAGESARKADRPELMRMIQYVAKHKTKYCIVHKVATSPPRSLRVCRRRLRRAAP